MMQKTQYPLLRKENIPAYLAVMAAWIGVSLVSAMLLVATSSATLEWLRAIGWALISTMAGMAIMFVASALNLRALRAGFGRLARGEPDPKIPAVWCPVLTMATQAAVELQRSLHERETAPGRSQR